MISNISYICYRIDINEEDFKKIINYDNTLLDKLEENDRILVKYSTINGTIYLNISFDNTEQHFYDLHNAKKIIRKYIKEAREAAKEENA